MKRHDETLLWQYAARELDADQSTLVEHHLGECLECREGLLAVRQARLILQDAQTPRPRVEWAKVDASISQIVEARLVRQAKASRVGWRLPLAFAAVAAMVVVVASSSKLELNRPAEVAVAPAPLPVPVSVPAQTEVEQALGLSRMGAELAIARVGERLLAGEVLRTAVGGRGQLMLPDGSRMRMAGGSQLALTRADEQDVALTLERGRVGVQASHRERRGFVVHTNGMAVRVIGTLFTVSQVAGVVEVAVAEGKVRVEPPEGEALSLVGGERVRFERGTWKALRGSASPAQLAELNELTTPPMIEATGAPRAPAGGLMPSGAIARRNDSAARHGAAQQSARVVGVALSPDPEAPHPEGLLPRKPPVPQGAATVWPNTIGVAPPAAAVQEEEVPQLEEKASVWPSMGGGPKTYEPRVLKRSSAKSVATPASAAPIAGATTSGSDVAPAYQLEVEAPAGEKAAQPIELSDWPREPQASAGQREPPPPQVEVRAVVESRPPTRARPIAAQKPKGEPLAEDLETLFLQRAERGLERGICDKYLLGLQEIAGDASHNERSEKARILRARCFDARVRPDLSEIEYRRYLEVWPKGRHSDEARKAIMP